MAINPIELNAQAIRLALFDVRDEDFIENDLQQIRLKIGHLNRQWDVFSANQQNLIDGAISERAREALQNYFTQIETVFNEVSEVLYARAMELKNQNEPENNENFQEHEFHDSSDDAIDERRHATHNTNNHTENRNVEQNNTVIQEQNTNNQSTQRIILEYPSSTKLENIWGEFDGNLTQWNGFHDRFKANVHDNTKLTGAMKFQYLRNSLKGYAAAAIGEWQQTNESYFEAWDRLNELYNRPYQISKELLNKFYNLPKIERATGGIIQKFSNVTHEVVRQLRALNYAVEHMDLIFVHGIHDKLDPDTSKQWELSRSCDNLSTTELLAFLDKQAKALFGTSLNNEQRALKENKKRASDNFHNKENTNNVQKFKPNNYFKEKKSEPEPSHNNFMCKICNKEKHPVYKCPSFLKMTLNERKQAAKEHVLCRNCLKSSHFYKDCNSGACLRCNIKHNSLLCPDNPKNHTVTNVNIQTKPRANKENKNQSKMVKKNSNSKRR